MDILNHSVTLFIFFFMARGAQRCVLVIAETLKITAYQCEEYLNLKNKTNVDPLVVESTSMQ